MPNFPSLSRSCFLLSQLARSIARVSPGEREREKEGGRDRGIIIIGIVISNDCRAAAEFYETPSSSDEPRRVDPRARAVTRNRLNLIVIENIIELTCSSSDNETTR